MNFGLPFLAAGYFVATDLLARVALLGIEQALFATAIEWSLGRINAMRRNFLSARATGSLASNEE